MEVHSELNSTRTTLQSPKSIERTSSSALDDDCHFVSSSDNSDVDPSDLNLSRLVLELPSGERSPLKIMVAKDSSVDILLDIISAHIGSADFRVRLGSKFLEAGKRMGEYVYEHLDVLHLVGRLIGGGKKKKKGAAVTERHTAKRDTVGPELKMSKCALKLALAMSDPFNPACEGVCGIGGTGSAAQTEKSTTRTRFTCTLGTYGYGYIWICPTLAHDNTTVFTTDSTYANGNTAVLLSADDTLATGVTGVYNSDLPYENGYLVGSTAINAPAVSGRILAVGVTGQYIGTNDDRGGMVVTHRSPLHANESVWQTATGGITTFTHILSYKDSQQLFGPKNGDIWINDFPSSDVERAFPSGDATAIELTYPFSSNENYLGGYTYTDPSSNAEVGAPTMIIAIQGAAGNTYSMEMVQHTEYVSSFSSSSTPVEQDTDGHEHLLNSLGSMIGKSKPKDRWKFLRQALHKSITMAAGIVIPATEAQLTAMLL